MLLRLRLPRRLPGPFDAEIGTTILEHQQTEVGIEQGHRIVSTHRLAGTSAEMLGAAAGCAAYSISNLKRSQQWRRRSMAQQAREQVPQR